MSVDDVDEGKKYDHIIYVGISLFLSHLCRFNSRRVKHETNRFVINSTLITIKPPYLTKEVKSCWLGWGCWNTCVAICLLIWLGFDSHSTHSNKRAIARQTTKLTTLKIKKKSEKKNFNKQASDFNPELNKYCEKIIKELKKMLNWSWQALISLKYKLRLPHIHRRFYYWINFHFHVHKCLRLRYDCGSDRQTISPIVPRFF